MVKQCLQNETCVKNNGLTIVYSVPLLPHKVYHLTMMPNPAAAKVPIPQLPPNLVASAPEMENEDQGGLQIGTYRK